MNPRHPIYIVSKGRADTRLTSRALHALGVPHFIVVEEAELEQYRAAVDGSAELLVLDPAYQRDYDAFDELGDTKSKGPGPARNFAWEHSIAAGDEWHWVMDDNIRGFYRLNQNLKTPVADGTLFRCMEDFSARYDNVMMAGPNYFMFASRKTQVPAFVINTRIYSCNLIRNAAPYRWRGRYNEDTDLSLRMLKDGWATVQFNAFLQEKTTTQQMGGGNTEAFYAEEGTLPKSQMLVDMHPDVTKLVQRFGRWHHQVDYKPYKKNRLRLAPGIEVVEGVNDYGMVLQQQRGDEWVTIPTDEALKPRTTSSVQARSSLVVGASFPATSDEELTYGEPEPTSRNLSAAELAAFQRLKGLACAAPTAT